MAHPVFGLSRELNTAQVLPSEFLIFAAGVNETAHGSFMFDADSAREVMRDFALRGVDYVIDLQHDSLDPDKRLLRNDAADAMGWFSVEVRPDGSLWATQVRWSAEGERRLRGRLQRYTSPAATYDPETRRVLSLVNAALCSDPATRRIAPLVAASRTGMLSARVPNKLRRQVQALALTRGTTSSAIVKLAIGRLTGKQVPADLLRDLLAALGLEAGATPEEITQALTDLLANLPDKKAPAASDTSPADLIVPGELKLSAETRAKIKARGLTVAEFLKRRSVAIKRST